MDSTTQYPSLKLTADRLEQQAPGKLSLSPTLFWDVHYADIEPEKHANWLAKRVLEYGDWPDWQMLMQYYGRARLAEITTSIRSLNPRALAFCKVWFDLPESAFRCSRQKQSL